LNFGILSFGFTGGVWPVVQRELRQGARRPFNFWLRVGGAAGGTVLLYLVTRSAREGEPALGIRLFADLHTLLLALICAIVPAMSADCIAREKREGTLGLLFLTPLTAGGIVVGKGLVQALRAFTLWLAVLPVLVVPFIAGGVGWADVTSAVAMEFCVAVFCLAGGILASAAAKGRATAFVLALTFASGLVFVFSQMLALSYATQTPRPPFSGYGANPNSVGELWSTGRSLLTGLPARDAGGFFNRRFAFRRSGYVTSVHIVRPVPYRPIPANPAGFGRPFVPVPYRPIPPNPPGRGSSYVIAGGPSGLSLPPGTVLPTGGVVMAPSPPPVRFAPPVIRVAGPMSAGPSPGWSGYFGPTPATRVWPSLCLESVVVAPVFGLLILGLAAHCVKRSWKDRSPSLRRQEWLKRFCTPLSILQKWFSRRMRRSLDRNPIAWLQQYSWKARLSKWGLCLAVVLFERIAAANWDDIDLIQERLVWVMGAVFTFVGVNSFLAEKRSGALELMLVTPLPVNQIIAGRVWGLWKQFLPAGLIIAASSLVAQTEAISWAEMLTRTFPIITSFMALPVFATYFALRVKNLIVAALLTWAALLVSWYLGRQIIDLMAHSIGMLDPPLTVMVIPLCNAALALAACFLLRHSLSRRIYSF
jgi:ABC-type transport system involved in multi-copper enzyme maturation permease subunit